VPEAEDIFSAAIELPAPGERADYIKNACASDARLLKLVQGLVNAYFRAGNFLESPASIFVQSSGDQIQETPGTTIGRYKLLEQIGEGGFAVVFMAEQETPVRRKVALKIIKAGMDTKQIVARFEAERQALAMMDHSSIAKVFDAGATEAGRPYFVMELVKGIPITNYCDQHDLSIAQRLDLFMQVCQAVQHAHQKGVIHRDLKPTNVLVSTHDGRPLTKVIDFGIAKATEARLTEKTLFTDFRQLIGTPAYMSPEQADGSLDIDIRSDVYSLGVLLYELLAGAPPFGSKELRSKGFAEMQRIIREVEPPTPSTRLSCQAKAAQTATARLRKIDPKRLPKLLRGELDWIVMRAIEKDRNRRYQSASSLAEDLQRYRTDRPVEARRPTPSYRLKKFIRRNKLVVFSGIAVLLAVMIGLAVASIGFVRARHEAIRSEQVAQFLKDMLKGVGPSVALGRDTKLLHEILDKTATRVQHDFADNPAVLSELCYILGTTYEDLDEDNRAEPMFQNAVEQYRLAFGNENTHVALALGRLGLVQAWLNRGSGGRITCGEAVQIARKCGDKGVLAHCLYYYAGSLTAPIITPESAPFLREAIALEKEAGDDPSFLARCLLHLGASLDDEPGYRAEAESMMREALALHRAQVPPDDAHIANDLFVLGQCLLKGGKLDEAEAIARENVDFSHRVYDKDHINREFYLGLLGHVLMVRGKWEAVETLFKEAVDSSPSNARYWEMLGDLNGRRGHWQAAVEQLTRTVELNPNVDGNNGAFFLAVALVRAGQLDEYRAHCHRFLERCSDARDHYGHYLAALASLMLPVEGADLDRACQYADSGAVREHGESLSSESTFGKALAEYRRGHFASAIDWADRATNSSDEGHAGPAKAANYFIEACANAALREFETGRAALSRGDEFENQLQSHAASDFMAKWADWAVANHLRDEAVELMEKSSQATKP
jgi:serine/threonine protein kinase/tetratricopeptide (TPR) repeat protein